MSYGNVGTPRFLVSIYDYMNSAGLLTTTTRLEYVLLNPTQKIILYQAGGWDGFNDTRSFPEHSVTLANLIGSHGFVAHLGHNYNSCGVKVGVQEGAPEYNGVYSIVPIANAEFEGSRLTPLQDGYSIFLCNYGNMDLGTCGLRYESGVWGEVDPNAYNGLDVKVGSIIFGKYIDMPFSPDLSVKMSHEYDGVKTITTKGGATLSNTSYNKPPMWGDLEAWQLSDDTDWQYSGRRTWDLSFSYISDTDLEPSDYATTSDNFFSDVIHKTMGGSLPFIFQPDNTVEDFAIARFDMNSFTRTQVANNVYNIKLKIRESW